MRITIRKSAATVLARSLSQGARVFAITAICLFGTPFDAHGQSRISLQLVDSITRPGVIAQVRRSGKAGDADLLVVERTAATPELLAAMIQSLEASRVRHGQRARRSLAIDFNEGLRLAPLEERARVRLRRIIDRARATKEARVTVPESILSAERPGPSR